MAEDACPDCGGGIRTVITEGGKHRTLDSIPHPDGNHVIVTRESDGAVRARVLTGRDMPAQSGRGHRVHRCLPVGPGPLCSVCYEPMNARLVELLGLDTHVGIGCDRQYDRALIELGLPRVIVRRPRARR
jgi:hypothetical protein